MTLTSALIACFLLQHPINIHRESRKTRLVMTGLSLKIVAWSTNNVKH